MSHWRSRVAVLLLALACLSLVTPAFAQTADPQFLEARRLFDALDYEKAVRALDEVIARLQGLEANDPSRLATLPEAYEMRGRSKFALGDLDGARNDFVLLLRTNAAYTLTGQVSPRVVALFEETMASTVTPLILSVLPPSATVTIDGRPVPSGGTIPVAVGPHVVAAEQLGYTPARETITAEAGMPSELAISLQRVSSVLTILTSPGGVEVMVNGVSRGATNPGPPAATYNDLVTSAGLMPADVSAAMVLSELTNGSHVVELRRDCYVTVERRIAVDRPDDYTLGPIALERAMARLTVKTSQPDAQVYIDGQVRGTAPLSVSDLCQGEHAIELRSAGGRYFRRVNATPGAEILIDGVMKPAFALLSVSGQAESVGADLRVLVERAFENSQAITLFAPPAAEAEAAVKEQQLPSGWLAFDTARRPIGVAGDILPPTRREASSKLSSAFGVQGVASLAVIDRNRVTLSLLAAGSSEPDVLELTLDNPQAMSAAIAALDRTPSLFRPAMGLVAVDIADVEGAVVVSVDANGPAAQAGIEPGDAIIGADGQAVANAVALATLLDARTDATSIPLQVRDRAGVVAPATVNMALTPRVIGTTDRSLMINRLLVHFRSRLLESPQGAEAAVLRLNLAAALVRVEAWSEAREALLQVDLPEGPGVSRGTVQYLLGLCAERLGNMSEAQAAYKEALGSEGLLTEDGPAVRDLAEARLSVLQSRAGGAQ
ncbi:MAG: PEGA domain-containing protein [Vicinamibacterales bacterium]